MITKLGQFIFGIRAGNYTRLALSNMVNLPVTIFVATIIGATTASHVPHHHIDCKEFIKGASFNESQAVGTWYRLHKTRGGVCAQISIVKEEEKKSLLERFGDHVKDVKWDLLTLRLEIPCNSTQPGETRVYYLEKVKSDGSYIFIPIPHEETDKENSATLAINPAILKMVDRYLVILDCDHRFVFVLGKSPQIPEKIDNNLRKLIDINT